MDVKFADIWSDKHNTDVAYKRWTDSVDLTSNAQNDNSPRATAYHGRV